MKFRTLLSKLLYPFFYLKVQRELSRTDSILAIYGHDQKKEPFELLVRWLVKHDYQFITPQELYLYVMGEKLQNGRFVWLSFDDGWKSNYDNVLPVLKQYGIPATVFVATKGVEDGYYWFMRAFQNRVSPYYSEVGELWEMPNKDRVEIIDKLPAYSGERETMNRRELQMMTDSGLVNWGNHTHDHVMSNNCTTEELIREINKCSSKMKEYVGDDCSFIYSYPNGNLDPKSAELIQNIGFKMAATVKIGRIYPGDNPFDLKRNEFKNGCLEENILQIFGLWTPFFDKIKKILIIRDKK